MLNRLIEKLNGHAADAASLAQALDQLGRERIEARAGLTEVQERRRLALLDDVSDAGLDKLEREVARAQSRIEKLNLAEPALREQLQAAQIATRQRRWIEIRQSALAAAKDMLVSARTTTVKAWAYAAILEQARGQGYEREIASLPMIPAMGGGALICAPELLDRFEAAIAGNSANSAASAPTTAPLRPRPRASLQHAIDSNLGPPQPQTAARVADDLGELAPAQVRVRYIGVGGWAPRDDQPQCAYGQILRMPRSAAERVANLGIVEILTASPAAAPANDEART
jgi:hypothetical protein